MIPYVICINVKYREKLERSRVVEKTGIITGEQMDESEVARILLSSQIISRLYNHTHIHHSSHFTYKISMERIAGSGFLCSLYYDSYMAAVRW